MKTLLTTLVLSALALGFFPTPASADNYDIDSSKYGAIAYSPKTGKYGYAWNYSTRYSAEKAALSEVKADDAKVLTWVKFGWAVLVIAEDNAYGHATTYGEGANSADAYKESLKELRKHSDAKVKTIVVICSGDVKPKIINK